MKTILKYKKEILYTIGFILLLYIVYKVVKYLEAKRQNDLIDKNTATTTVNGTATTVNIGTKAAEIYDALHGSVWSEDETKAINAVLQVPKPLIPQLSQTYFAISGFNLKQDLQKYLSASEWLQIAHLFN